MNVKANKIDDANATIEAQIANAEVAANLEKIAKELSKTAKIAGFRKGKVPVSAVKKQYGERLVQDAEAEALRDVLSAGLAELGVPSEAMIGEPQITKFDKGEENIDVEVAVAIRPVIDLGDYKALVPEFTKPKISAAVVKERIDELALAKAPFETVEEDRALKEGDSAMIDFEGFLGGEAFQGGKAEDFSLTLGSNQFIPGFEEQVIGMKKDEEKTIKITFPENYGGEELAGKEAEFKVKVKEIQTKKKPRHDAKLAKQMLPGEEEATIEMLTEKVHAQLESEEVTKLYNEELKPQILELLVEKINVALPKFVVEQEMDMALNKKAQTM
ncbi:MAG: trigger factor, partial [Thiovulaceae bacterium]|nr:trigger factor [Sulfurimonadaceae bacterium]